MKYFIIREKIPANYLIGQSWLLIAFKWKGNT